MVAMRPGLERIAGGKFGEGLKTLTVQRCVAVPPWPSLTTSSTTWLPSCAAVGVHAMTPVVETTVMPAGAAWRWNASESESKAFASYRYAAPTLVWVTGIVMKTGAELAGASNDVVTEKRCRSKFSKLSGIAVLVAPGARPVVGNSVSKVT